MIDLVSMHEVTINADVRIARAQGGVTTRQYNDATLSHGLVTPFGDSPSVGIAGLTLGGGAGWLGRKLGLALDSLLAVELVTADARVLRVNATEHPDLFWAIRGGGGNFGIVTSLDLRLIRSEGSSGAFSTCRRPPKRSAASSRSPGTREPQPEHPSRRTAKLKMTNSLRR